MSRKTLLATIGGHHKGFIDCGSDSIILINSSILKIPFMIILEEEPPTY